MASNAEIAKLALQHIGDRFDLDTLSDATTEAEQIDLVFDIVRDQLLRQHPWKFAKRFTSPTVSSDTPPAEWAYMYPYPDDAVKVVRIVNPLGRDLPPIPFDVAIHSTGQKMLLTDYEDPEIQYTEQVTDPYMFDPHFVVAFSFALAAAITLPLTGDKQLRREMENEAATQFSLAASEDSNEGVEPEHTRDPDWIRARA